VGFASLEALGVKDFFSVIVGLDDTLASKPDPAPFILAARRLRALREAASPPSARAEAPSSPEALAAGTAAQESPFAGLVSLGDRYDVDLAPALALGMGAILVESVSEIYSLPEILVSGL
jgi:FMN phosphatase YigB (HAD superfamily)